MSYNGTLCNRIILCLEITFTQVFQRREDGSVDFFLDWASYKAGFGNVTGEHWLGNDNMYTISNNYNKTYQLRVDMNKGNELRFAVYGKFCIADEFGKYKLSLEAYDRKSDAGKVIIIISFFNLYRRAHHILTLSLTFVKFLTLLRNLACKFILGHTTNSLICRHRSDLISKILIRP